VSRTDALQISSHQSGATLTPAQKRFNTLIRQIEQARQTLKAWHENVVAYRQAHIQVLRPIEIELMAQRRQWVLALDGLLAQRNWTKAERGTMRELLRDAAEQVLLAADDEDTEMKALFDKHAEVDFDTEQREMMLMMKGLTEAMTGLDLGDAEEIDSEKELFARVEQGLRERAQTQQAQHEARPARRRKSAAQQKREAEAQQATRSVREIYRQLASALHPDRETDAQQRAEKTALMQKVNQAYAANDLLALLELQLQIEQIDSSHIANASAERLKHYNKVLAEQLTELRREIEGVELGFSMEFGLSHDRALNPRRLGELLEQTSREWQIELRVQQHDLRMLNDVAATKRWLKRQKQLLRQADLDWGFDEF
jgi:PIN domain nuclease of toxin-antitoxin system